MNNAINETHNTKHPTKELTSPIRCEINSIQKLILNRFKLQGLTSEVVRITPAMAEYILFNYNDGNRPRTKNHVDRLAKIIKSGEFITTSQGISFSSNRKLLDGQHRLAAIAQSGVAVEIYVTFGVHPSAFSVYDTGKKRGAADAFHIAGLKNTKPLAAAARLLEAVELGKCNGDLTISNQRALEIVSEHPYLDEAASIGGAIAKKLKFQESAAIVGIYSILHHSKIANKLDEFVGKLTVGDNLEKNSPILTLRNGLIGIKGRRSFEGDLRGGIPRAASTAAHIILAWNAWVNGRKTFIKWNHTNDFPEAE